MSTPTPTTPDTGHLATASRVWAEMEDERVKLGTSEGATRFIRALGERQHGVVARRQLLRVGLGESLVKERVAGGRLVLLHRGVYAVGHRRSDASHRWMAAVLACGDHAALSHRSAAHLWGLRRSRGPVEVTRTSGARARPGIAVRQTPVLEGVDLTRESGIPVTTLERTLLDLASDLDRRALERVVVEADRSGRLSWPKLEASIDRATGWAGVARLRRVVESIDPRAKETLSPLEVDLLALCRQAGLPLPQVNVLVEGRLVDFLWPREKVVVETDGYRYHSDRLAFERDREVTVALASAGYEVLRATYRMLHRDPGPFLSLLRRKLHGGPHIPTRSG